ncbi:23S rRNA (adenine(2030)-N(6))-methyltransferase RlmJ [Phenylobacterium immobile]|uniref:23S rRNA (adenine(2030)-N(6))-methyltransferase RlmJ n=1 Tax=Phenylobacterium immobile TaxID=21 RepID=UPI000A72B8B1|nr:23S rRNA (adenine(2030)-N(6))-methyltransferase RlmJ [Phenylobacterium immobile]
MNYRHAFHAGNFADLVKHAALLELLARLPRPLSVIDTHAGRGLYDLAGPEARKSGEADAGIARLLAAEAPPAFDRLKAAVRRLNGGGPLQRYPGSPLLIVDALGGKGVYLGCELRPEEHAALRGALKGRKSVQTEAADGYRAAVAHCPSRGDVLVLIDPPFERADDYERIVDTIADVRRHNPAAVALIWLPLKDLATFDAFLRDIEDVSDDLLVCETRIRPLTDPLKMNGCALVLVGGPPGMESICKEVGDWIAANLGEAGEARVYRP